MKEIRIHGRGEQGPLVLAQFMAIAALEDGKYGQAFPFLGGAGSPQAQRIMIFREGKLNEKMKLAKALAGIPSRKNV